MDKFESLQVIKSHQAEFTSRKRETSSKRRQYKIEHQPNTEFEVVFGEKTDAYVRFFQNSDILRCGLRAWLRKLHLLSCFLRGVPYKKVEEKVLTPASSWDLQAVATYYNLCSVDRNELKTWLEAQ